MQNAFDCEVTAAFLNSGRTIANAANAAAVIAGVGCWWSVHQPVVAMLVVSLVAFVVETWFALRVSIDRSLFMALTTRDDSAERLDALLVDWKFVKAAPPRSMADRSRAALALWRKQSVALAVQILSLFSAVILQMVKS